MAEKQVTLGYLKTTVPTMKLFAVGELDRTPANCIPRLCNVTVAKLQVLQPLGVDLTSVNLAVKMQSSKRILRSNEIPLLSNGLLDTELQLTFSLQGDKVIHKSFGFGIINIQTSPFAKLQLYPHFLKRDGNVLQIMLQKRKKYKNRALLGCKTLAVGYINMTQILQRPIDRILDLGHEGKEKSVVLARVNLVSLSSQPVDTEEPAERPKDFLTDAIIDRATELDDSEEDEDYSSPDDGSDSETILEGGSLHQMHRRLRRLRVNRATNLPPNARQRNLKQRFASLLKKFKVREVMQAFEHDQGLGPQPDEVDEEEIEDLFNELEDLSDSGPEVDTISISSTPKPTLRPYFSSSKSLLNDGITSAEKLVAERYSDDESSKKADSDPMETWTDQEQSDTQGLTSSSPKDDKSKSNLVKFFRESNNQSSEKKRANVSGSSTPRLDKSAVERKNSALTNLLNSQPRKVLLEHLARIFPSEDCELPDHVILINTLESHGSTLSASLSEWGHRVISTMSPGDVKATLGLLINKLQKFCNSNAKDPRPMKIVVIGSDTYINCVLRPYVEQISSKPRDFQSMFRFLCIPLGGVNSIAKYLASIDSIYGATFVSESWKDIMDKWDKQDVQEAMNRIQQYLAQAQCTLNLPIAEAVITYKGKSDDESCQAFIPFITDVRLGSGDVTSCCSVDVEEMSGFQTSPPSASTMAGSPPGSSPQSVSVGLAVDRPRGETTPPSSPNIAATHASTTRMASEPITDKEPLELQIDYWLLRGPNRDDKEKEKMRGDGGKYTVKGTFRTIQVSRLAPLGVAPPQDPNSSVTHLTFSYATKEKKQRIIRIGKKREREKETESRREVIDGICRLLASTKSQTLTVTIDSVEWTNVKFFQISSQWQTQIKSFPVALFSLQ